MNLLVAGGTGFLGRRLCAALGAEGYRVIVLSRQPAVNGAIPAGVAQIVTWDPAHVDAGQPWVREMGRVDAVVNLSGENVAGRGPLPRRWDPAFKAALRASRVDATRAVIEALALTPSEQRPRVLVNASAIGYYGDRGDEVLTEASLPGTDFFANLCRDWEAAAAAAEPLGVRVVRLRTGVVMARGAMAADLLVLASRLGVGGPLGSGKQWWSWIHRDDVVGLIRHAVQSEAVRGALNAVAPTPRRMVDFSRVLGNLLHRPSLVPAPALALRLAFGEVADALLLASQHVLPTEASRTGYTYRYPSLDAAFREIVDPLGAEPPQPANGVG